MKPRSPKTFAAAVTRIKAVLGESTCAEIVDRSESLIRKWADPDHESQPSLSQAVALDSAYVSSGRGDPPLLQVY